MESFSQILDLSQLSNNVNNNVNDNNNTNNNNNVKYGIFSVNCEYNMFKKINHINGTCPICINNNDEDDSNNEYDKDEDDEDEDDEDEDNEDNEDEDEEDEDNNKKNIKSINIRTPCGHEFHKKCFKKWFKRSQSCPVCRKTFDKKSILFDEIKNINATMIDNYDNINILDIAKMYNFYCDECDSKIENITYFDKKNITYNLCEKCHIEEKNKEKYDKIVLNVDDSLIFPQNLFKLFITNLNITAKINIKSKYFQMYNCIFNDAYINCKKILIENSKNNNDINIKNCNILNVTGSTLNNFNLENTLINNNITYLSFTNTIIDDTNDGTNDDTNKVINNNINDDIKNKILFSQYNMPTLTNIFNNLIELKINTISEMICKFDVSFNAIKNIFIENIKFPSFPVINKNVENICLLNICDNLTEELIFENNNLTNLILEKFNINKIKIINNKNLSKIRIVKCNLKHIKNIPDTIKYLELQNNNLTSICNMKNLKKILYLDLSFNKLKGTIKLPDVCSICSLFLNNNFIKNVELFSQEYEHLILGTLDLSNNCLEKIDLKNNKISIICLNNNNLSEFKYTYKCESLCCQHNKLTCVNIPEHIDNINLSNNKLEKICVNFKDNNIINNANFENNPLTDIIFTNSKTNKNIENFNIKNTNIKNIIFLKESYSVIYESLINGIFNKYHKYLYKILNNNDESDNKSNNDERDNDESDNDESDNDESDNDESDNNESIFIEDLESQYTFNSESNLDPDADYLSDDDIYMNVNSFISDILNNEQNNNTQKELNLNKHTIPSNKYCTLKNSINLNIKKFEYSENIQLINKFIVKNNDSAIIFNRNEKLKYSNI